jgi:hypothetical protein
VIQDAAGHACLLVLPSDRPSHRKEAVAVEQLLAALLQVSGGVGCTGWASPLVKVTCCLALPVKDACLL